MSTYTAFAKTRIPAFYFQSLQAVRRRSVRCITCLRRSVNSKRDQVIQHKNAIHQVGVTSLLRTVAFNKVLPVRNYACNYEKSTELSYEDLVALLESGGIQLIDVREKREIQEQGAFPGSVNIPLVNLKEALTVAENEYLQRYELDIMLEDLKNGNKDSCHISSNI
ncbi:hypothetical protein KUTeg_018618 [Tegillarca granosa]|uniref:Rhodanese domain-containing protein n=1 Tax=Tegillarca granosa TaxID=220873 RepID=A0ABQ9EKA3_TEGGR|nr:hypothetical protein KUTeg_018618 [Tegillarca granosa]